MQLYTANEPGYRVRGRGDPVPRANDYDHGPAIHYNDRCTNHHNHDVSTEHHATADLLQRDVPVPG